MGRGRLFISFKESLSCEDIDSAEDESLNFESKSLCFVLEMRGVVRDLGSSSAHRRMVREGVAL